MTKLSSIILFQKNQGHVFSKVCNVCGREGVDVYRRGKFDNIILCGKHNAQMEKYGYILKRTCKDPNIINYYDRCIGVDLMNKKMEKIGESFVSLDMLPIIENIKWHKTSSGYARGRLANGKHVLMHKLLFKAPKGLYIDHINGDKLDNRKQNIRFCTKSQNAMNSVRKWGHTSCKVKGVSFDKRINKYRSYIKIDQKQIFGGYFKKEKDAIKSRVDLDLKYFKEYSCFYTHDKQ